LASSRYSGNVIDLTDVTVAWAAFEEINRVRVIIEVSMAVRGAIREPRLFGQAFRLLHGSGAAESLAYVSANSWVLDHRNLDAAVFHLLYTLDGLIASAELGGVPKKEA
jgi:hypothetical protein